MKKQTTRGISKSLPTLAHYRVHDSSLPFSALLSCDPPSSLPVHIATICKTWLQLGSSLSCHTAATPIPKTFTPLGYNLTCSHCWYFCNKKRKRSFRHLYLAHRDITARILACISSFFLRLSVGVHTLCSQSAQTQSKVSTTRKISYFVYHVLSCSLTLWRRNFL